MYQEKNLNHYGADAFSHHIAGAAAFLDCSGASLRGSLTKMQQNKIAILKICFHIQNNIRMITGDFNLQ